MFSSARRRNPGTASAVCPPSGARAARYFVTGAFAEIADNTVSVLAEDAVSEDEVTADWLSDRIVTARSAWIKANSTHSPARTRQRSRTRR